ncbi:MAG: hypothetical protein QXZ06_06980 [Candidatus Jordarchaeales archaeon]
MTENKDYRVEKPWVEGDFWIEIETGDGPIFQEYREKVERFLKKLDVLNRRNHSLANLVFLHAVCLGVLPHPIFAGVPNVHFFQPKRGRKQEVTFPIRMVMAVLGVSHRQAQAYHQAGLLLDLVNMLWEDKMRLFRQRIEQLYEEERRMREKNERGET